MKLILTTDQGMLVERALNEYAETVEKRLSIAQADEASSLISLEALDMEAMDTQEVLRNLRTAKEAQ